jgi:putative MATE family efflux protein
MSESSVSSPRPAAGQGPRQRPNLTEGPITKTLLLFSLPLMGSNVLQSLQTTVNQFWVSHTLGVNAITALVNANQIMFLMQSVIFGVTMAANILVAQSVGAKDLAMVKRVMGTAISFFFGLSVFVALVGWLLTPELLAAMHTPPEARSEAIVYLRILFASMPFSYFFMFIQMAQRGAGDARTPFYFMVLALALDIILNPLLIRGIGPFPKLGIAGSATSTLVGQGISFALLVVYLYRKRSVLVLWPGEFHLLKPNLEILNPMVLRGVPMSAQMFVMSGAGLVMIGFVNHYGALYGAAYGTATLLWNYLMMPGMAIGASVSSMAAQNVGANRWDRVEQIAVSGVASSTIVTGSIAALIYACGVLPLYLFLPPDSPTVPIALHIYRMVLWGFVLFNATFALSGVVRATGAVMAPLIILFISMWVIRVPFAWLLSPHFGPDAIWWSFPLGTITSSLLTFLYYRYGGWRKKRMFSPAIGQGVGRDSPLMNDLEEPAAV